MLQISKELKKRMEKEFRQYWDNKKKLHKLEMEIIEESNCSNNQSRSNTISDTTQQKVLKLTSTRTILYLEERIKYVENVIKKLKPYELQVFNYIFKDSYDALYCKTMKNVDKSTYYNIYNKAIRLLAEEWGEL